MAYQQPNGTIKQKRLWFSAEYHHFQFRNCWLLFNVNNLKILSSSPLDKQLLESAVNGITFNGLIKKMENYGEDAVAVRTRLKHLTEFKFFLPEGILPEKAKLGNPSLSATFMINVSQRCNLTCSYCYVNEGRFDYASLPIPLMNQETANQLVKKLYRSFPDFQTYDYHFYGGEPLLNFDAIREIVMSAESMASKTETQTEYHITTNGTLLRADIADFMDKYHFNVYFSIDGNKAVHDSERKYRDGRGSYHDVMKNLAYLRTKKHVHLICSSVIREDLSMSEVIKILENHGANQCKAERVRLDNQERLALKGETYEVYLKDIEMLFDHYVVNLSSGKKPLDYRFTSKILQLFAKARRNFFCPAGERMFGISADGEIYPCALHVGRPQSRLGHLQTGVDSKMQEIFRTKFSTDNQVECRTCWARYLCGGGCSAMVDRFGKEECAILQLECEIAIAIYQYFAKHNPLQILGLVSPSLVQWANENQ